MLEEKKTGSSRSQPGCAASPATSGSEPSAAFTPGPWVLHPRFPEYVVPAAHADRKVGGHADDAEDLRTYAQPIVVASWCKRHRSAPEVAANARLIAAAPDILSALREMLLACEEDCGVPDEHDLDDEAVGAGEDGDMALTFGMLRRARVAIAKALGPSAADTSEGQASPGMPSSDARVEEA